MGHIFRVKYYFILFPVCLLFNYTHTYTERDRDRDTKTERQSQRETEAEKQREQNTIMVPHASNLKIEEVEAGGSWISEQLEM